MSMRRKVHAEVDSEAGDPVSLWDEADAQVANIGKDTFWFFASPCTAANGCICSNNDHPCIVSRWRCLCVEGYSGTTDCYTNDEGCCSQVQKCCCIVNMCTFPPGCCGGAILDGQPGCAVCNIRCFGESYDDPDPSEHKKLIEETFLCYYVLCSGCGVKCGGDYPCCFGINKCLCCHGGTTTRGCCDDGVCCFTASKTCCFVNAGGCPPGGQSDDGIPLCAVMGCACGDSYDGESADSAEEPLQQEMM